MKISLVVTFFRSKNAKQLSDFGNRKIIVRAVCSYESFRSCCMWKGIIICPNRKVFMKLRATSNFGVVRTIAIFYYRMG